VTGARMMSRVMVVITWLYSSWQWFFKVSAAFRCTFLELHTSMMLRNLAQHPCISVFAA